MVQYGFFFDQSRCGACTTCMTVCKSWNMLPPGPVRWLRLFEYEKGAFPDTRVHAVFAPCYHCENPVCVDAAEGAMYKEEKYGAVLIDPDKATSPSLRKAWAVCPYGAISFESDAPDAKASMCTMCIDLVEKGKQPACVMACGWRALDFGPLDELLKKYGTNRDLEDLPSSTIAKPAIIFKPMNPRKPLLPYDKNKALALFARRDPLPPFYTDASEVTDLLEGLVSRGKLVLHAKSTQELVDATTGDG